MQPDNTEIGTVIMSNDDGGSIKLKLHGPMISKYFKTKAIT